MENITSTETKSVTDIYGINVFNDTVLKARLPKSIYKELKKVQNGDQVLSLEVAEVVAAAMRDWALEKGATHFTHWFQPLTGLTAEKHDSFISPTSDGKVLMEFSGKELIQGEPDASSFPNGGLRETFEARGYTAWDTTSPAFLKKDATGLTLCIPTAFIAYHGEALDKKTPLLRSMKAINEQAVRVLKALGNTTATKVTTTLGPEQEYFLVNKELFEARSDLLLTGRTVFGSLPAKGQEMDDHYFGAIPERAIAFMQELNEELWKLGISAKTQHNEVAPNQFELATIFDSNNVSVDSNQLVMEMMTKVANRQGLKCLLGEKPFAGVNGSGKHNNWSMGTNDGQNLLEPGKTPHENAQFLLFLSAVIKAVDKHAKLLRMSAANAGNDHRLGANEAPPAIISIFLGDQLEEILEAIAAGKEAIGKEGGKLTLGVNSLAQLPKDMTDRNRTSPFAFTGNKFEFRMVGSSASMAGPNVVLNAAVAQTLKDFADKLEGAKDVNKAITEIIKDTYNTHKRVVFNGNGYSDEWVVEAEKRGLPNIKSTPEIIPALLEKESKELFGEFGVFTEAELESRYHIYLEEYSGRINIEAGVAIQMAQTQIIPAANSYISEVAASIASVKSINDKLPTGSQEALLESLAVNVEGLQNKINELAVSLEKAQNEGEAFKQAMLYREDVFVKMNEARVFGDELERLVDKSLWPYPSYEDLLFTM